MRLLRARVTMVVRDTWLATAWLKPSMLEAAALVSRSTVHMPRLLSLVMPKMRTSFSDEALANWIPWTAKVSFLFVRGNLMAPVAVFTVTRVPAMVADWSWVVNMTKRLFWYAEAVETMVEMSAVDSRESTLQLMVLGMRVKRTIWSCLPREELS